MSQAAPRHLLVFILPALLAVAALLAVGAFHQRGLQAAQAAFVDGQAAALERIGFVARFGNDLAELHRRTGVMLELTATGRIDLHEADRLHETLSREISLLERHEARLAEIAQGVGMVLPLHERLEAYRAALRQAADHAAVRLPGNRRVIEQADLRFAELAQLAGGLLSATSARLQEEAEAQMHALEAALERVRLLRAVMLGGVLLLWVLFVLLLTRSLGRVTRALRGLATAERAPGRLEEVEALAASRSSLLRELARAALAFRDVLAAREAATAQLRERMKELGCLYDVTRITDRTDLDRDAMLDAVARRLPAALRFPAQAEAGILHDGRWFGERPGEGALRVPFRGLDGAAAEIVVAYRGTLPADAGPPFLGEELGLLDAVAERLAAAIERGRAAAADSRNLLAAVVNEAPLAIEIVDAETRRFLEVNNASCRILGYAREELLGMTPLDTQDDMPPGEMAALGRRVREEGAARFEARHRRKDGSAVEALVNVQLIQQRGRDYFLAMWEDITERKQQEERLRTLARAVEQSPSSIVITDLHGTIEYVNEAFERMTGHGRAALVGCDPRLLGAARTARPGFAAMWEALPRGETWRGELVNHRADGTEFLASAVVSPVRRPDGGISHHVGVLEDITETRRMALELERHRGRLEELVAERTAELMQAREAMEALGRDFTRVLETSPDLIALRDRELRFKACSQAYVRLAGQRDVREMLGRTVEECFPPERGAAIRAEERSQIAAGEEVRSFERTLPGPAGEARRFSMTRTMLRDAEGRFDGFLVIGRDISARAAAMEALARKEEEERLLLDSSSNGILGVGPDGHVTFANQAAAQMLRHPGPEALIGRRAHDLLRHGGPGGAPEQPGPIHRALVGHEMVAGEEGVFGRADGTALAVSCSVAPILHAGAVLGAVLSFEDIGARKEAEAELLRAKAADRAKTDFLSTMSHEIRTPMNAIIGFTHLLRRGVRDPRQQEQLGRVADAAQHLLGIINDILDLSKIEAGKLELEQGDILVAQMVERICGLVRDRAEAKGLALDTELDDLPPVLLGDELRLSQILLNFLSNAVKFTEAGRVALRGRVARRTPRGLVVRFEVADTGIGVPPAQQGLLFQPFQQADASTTRRFGGTGLGLAICQRLAVLMGGAVGLRSAPGEGSVFWVEVPLGEGRGQPSAGRGGPARAASGVLRGRRLLVVEDNPLDEEVATALLRDLGLEVEVAHDGNAAAARAAATGYDLILMDAQMAGMEARALAHAIRGGSRNADTPLLALTANASPTERAACLAAGINDHLLKPLDPAALHATLARWLSGEDVTAAPCPRGVTEAVGQAEARRVHARIAALLEASDMAAVGLFQQHAAALHALWGPRGPVIARLLDAFAFEEALAEMRQVAEAG